MMIMTIMFGISAALAVVRNLDDAGFLLALTPKAGSHPNPSHVQTSQALIQIQSQIQNQALIQIQIQSKSKSKSRLSSKSQSCSDKPGSHPNPKPNPKPGSHSNPNPIQIQIQKQALIQIPVMFRQAAGPKSSMDSNWNKNQIGQKKIVLSLELRVSMIIRHPLQWQCIAHSIILWSNSRSFNQNKTNFSPMQGREGVVVFEAVLKLGIENLPRPAHYTFPLLRVLTLQIQIQIQIQMQIQIEIQIAKHQYQCK